MSIQRIGVWVALGSVLAIGIARSALAQACDGAWPSSFPVVSAQGRVHALLTVPNAGGSPSIYIGGAFNSAGGVAATGIAALNGTRWNQVGNGLFGEVDAIAVFDDDGDGPHPQTLYAAGGFGSGVGSAVRYVAKLNGSTWEPLGDNPSNPVLALAVFDDDGPGPHQPALYVGGSFTAIGSSPISFIARWDGQAWTSVGGGVNGQVNALTVWDPDGDGPLPAALYAGGTFTTAGGQPASLIASWNGSSWSSLNAGLGGSDGPAVNALAVFDADGSGPQGSVLLAGGSFSTADGSSASRIASWDGHVWRALGSGVTGTVWSIASIDPDGAGPATPQVFVGGAFTSAGGAPANNVAKWNGSTWSGLSSGLKIDNSAASAACYALAGFNTGPTGSGPPTVLVGGTFNTAGGSPASNLAEWTGTAWSIRARGLNDGAECSTVFDGDGAGPNPPAVIIGGRFTQAGDVLANHIVKLDGGAFAPLGAGMNGSVQCVTSFDDDGDGPNPPALYAGGEFTTAGGVPANYIAKWNGSTWTPLGSGMDGTVFAITSFDEDGAGPGPAHLYAAGAFSTAGGVPANNIARWDGAAWSALGVGTNNTVYCMTVFDRDGPGPSLPALYVGGRFTGAGSRFPMPAGIARWTGTDWSTAIEGGSPNIPFGSIYGVRAMLVRDDDGSGPLLPALYITGDFDGVNFGSQNANGIARWNGSTWSTLGAGLQNALGGRTYGATLASFDDDGDGSQPPALYVGGSFGVAGNVTTNNVARWNGTSWSAAGNADGEVLTLSSFDADGPSGRPPVLLAGGRFGSLGGVANQRLGVRLPGGPALIASQPAGATSGPGGTAVFTVGLEATTTPSPQFRWRRDGADLTDGGAISGSATLSLTISPVGMGDAGGYSLRITNACGVTLSNSATLTVVCAADFNGDGVLDPDDLSDYIGCFFATPACAMADFNHDGVSDPDDLADYIGAFFSGC